MAGQGERYQPEIFSEASPVFTILPRHQATELRYGEDRISLVKLLSVTTGVMVTTVFKSTVVRDPGGRVVKSSSSKELSDSDGSDPVGKLKITRYRYVTMTSKSHTISVNVNYSV